MRQLGPPDTTRAAGEPAWLGRLVDAEPRVVLMGPYLFYLLLMMPADLFTPAWLPAYIALHTLLALALVCMMRRHLPPLGRPHLRLAILFGVSAAALWIAGQHAFDGLSLAGRSLGGRLPLYPGTPTVYDPHADYGDGPAFWLYAVLKVGRSMTAVPVVEELFWRGFLLRALVNWDRYDTVPWGTFSWRAMIGTASLSVLQHPDNWGVSIGCWLLFNALFYWKKSLCFVIVTHAVTNLALYAYTIGAADWRFW